MENSILKIDDLCPAEGATHRAKRKGRGRSSGMGKTSCRGHNGEGQRAGRSKKRGFEGGQMPSYRKFPKLKGFKPPRTIMYAEINVKDLNKLEADIIDLEKLRELGYIKSKKYEALRVLGNGEINKAVKVKANYVTPSAKEKIESAGGSVEVI